MSEQELSNYLFSITGIKKGLFESYNSHIERCYLAMVTKITTLNKGTFETLNHFITRALKEYAAKSGFIKKKFLESNSDYEYRSYQHLQSMYSTKNCQELLIQLYSSKPLWKTYSEKAHVKAKSEFRTLEVTYRGETRVVEIIYLGYAQTGDIIRGHCDGYDRYDFSKVIVGDAYNEGGNTYINICFEGGEWQKYYYYEEVQRLIY